MDHYGSGIKVKDVIALLQAHDPESPVAVEGCDCYGAASGVDVFTSTGQQIILITRKED